MYNGIKYTNLVNTWKDNPPRTFDCYGVTNMYKPINIGEYPKNLVFDGKAWAKIQHYVSEYANLECGGMGIVSIANPLYITEFELIKQEVSGATVRFDPFAFGEFVDNQFDRFKRQPCEVNRIWIHTHPGMCPHPSIVDEETFLTNYGKHSWAIMVVISRDCVYARIHFSAGPAGDFCIPVVLSEKYVSTEEDIQLWNQEYLEKVTQVVYTYRNVRQPNITHSIDYSDAEWWDKYYSDGYPNCNNLGYEPKSLPLNTQQIEQVSESVCDHVIASQLHHDSEYHGVGPETIAYMRSRLQVKDEMTDDEVIDLILNERYSTMA
jgi:proteasome lid subunit RPN8/RPN11